MFLKELMLFFFLCSAFGFVCDPNQHGPRDQGIGAPCGGPCNMHGTCQHSLRCAQACNSPHHALLFGNFKSAGVCEHTKIEQESRVLAGGKREQSEICDPSLVDIAKHALVKLDAESNSINRMQLIRMVSVQTQVVAGIKYFIEMDAAESSCTKSNKQGYQECKEPIDAEQVARYEVTLLHQPWINKDPLLTGWKKAQQHCNCPPAMVVWQCSLHQYFKQMSGETCQYYQASSTQSENSEKERDDTLQPRSTEPTQQLPIGIGSLKNNSEILKPILKNKFHSVGNKIMDSQGPDEPAPKSEDRAGQSTMALTLTVIVCVIALVAATAVVLIRRHSSAHNFTQHQSSAHISIQEIGPMGGADSALVASSSSLTAASL